ncbi:MAG: hypothetical protein HY703_11650 [Gemmatimonadetes bacterium]|nr:hypothetical protein [Gemmatimonadota bacterium]
MRRRLLMIALLGLATLPSCDDEEPTPPPDAIPRDQVVGVYEPTELVFDVQGQLPEKNILERVEPPDRPQLVITRTDTAQLVFRDPATGLVRAENGTYVLLSDGIGLRFSGSSALQQILLPARMDLKFNSEAATLSFSGEVFVPVPQLKALVPEFAQEPWVDTVPGVLRVVFTRTRR